MDTSPLLISPQEDDEFDDADDQVKAKQESGKQHSNYKYVLLRNTTLKIEQPNRPRNHFASQTTPSQDGDYISLANEEPHDEIAQNEEVQEYLEELKGEIERNPFGRGIVISITSIKGAGIPKEFELPDIHCGSEKLLKKFKRLNYACIYFRDLSVAKYKSLFKALSILKGFPRSYKRIIFHYNGHGKCHSLLVKDGIIPRDFVISSLSKLPLSKYLIFDCCSSTDYLPNYVHRYNLKNDKDIFIIDAAPPDKLAYAYDGYGVLTQAIISLLDSQVSVSFSQFFTVYVPQKAEELIDEVNKKRQKEGKAGIDINPRVTGSLKEDALIRKPYEYLQTKICAFCHSFSCCTKIVCSTFCSILLVFLLLFLVYFVLLKEPPVQSQDSYLITSTQLRYCDIGGPTSILDLVRYESFRFTFSGDKDHSVIIISVPQHMIDPLTQNINDSYFYDPRYPQPIQVTPGIDRNYIPINSYNNPVYFLPGSVISFDFSVVNGTRLYSASIYIFVNDIASNNFIHIGKFPSSVEHFNIIDNIKQKYTFRYRVESPDYRFFVLQTDTFDGMVFNVSFNAEWKHLNDSDNAYLAYKSYVLSTLNPIPVAPNLYHVLLCKLQKPQGIEPHYGYYNVKYPLRTTAVIIIAIIFALISVILLSVCFLFLYKFYTFYKR